MANYGIGIAIMASATKAQLQALAAGLNPITALDPLGSGAYVLAFNNAPIVKSNSPKYGNEYYNIKGVIVYNSDVADATVAAIAPLSDRGVREVMENPPLANLQLLDDESKKYAAQDGASHFWMIHPGDNLSVASAAALLAKFTALPVPAKDGGPA